MLWSIVGAGGLLFKVLMPLVAYLGYRTSQRKRSGSGRMWVWFCLWWEIMGVIRCRVTPL
jgi:hypothetical protein